MKHFLRFFLAVLLSIAGLSRVWAQTAPPDAARQQLDQIFAPLDKTQVPSGYLDEYGERLLGLRAYNGVLADSNSLDLSAFCFLRATIYSARVTGTDTLPSLPELNRRFGAWRQGASGAPNPIAVQYMNYHRIRPDALDNNLLQVQNDQVYDVPGRSQSPYEAATLFAAAPYYPVSYTGSVSFVFPRNLYLTNNPGTTVAALYLDFDDGRGYVRAYWNQPVATTYGTPGHKHVRVKLVYQVPRPLNSTSTRAGTTAAAAQPSSFSLESHFDLEVLQTSVARYGTSNDMTHPITPTAAHDGATVSVRYGQGHTRLTKPFIIVEQYNLASILERLAPKLLPCDNRNNTIETFLDKIAQQPSPYNFNDALHDLGQYDLVYIDFAKNTDDIRRNALIFEEVVRWVNEQKVGAPGAERNVVMGQSMGGLISRYGLAEMTKLPADPDPVTGRNRNDPDTRLLVLHDSPQRGAYSPVGTQQLTRALDIPAIFGWKLREFSNEADAAVTILDEPASQQLSILNATTPRTGGVQANTFLEGANSPYRSMIDNVPGATYEIIATSDGSQCGRPQNTPTGIQISGIQNDYFLRPFLPLSPLNPLRDFNVKAEGAAYGLPAYGQTALTSRLRVYMQYNLCIGLGPFGRICLPTISVNFLNETADSPPNTLPYETLPGGNTNPADNLPCVDQSNTYLPFVLRFYSQTSLYNGDLCFVPTYSALDVPVASTGSAYAKYNNSVSDSPSPPGGNSQPKVLRYIAQENVNGAGSLFNQPHLRFTARNGEWIFNEMQRPVNSNTNSIGCTSECLTPADLTFAGPPTVCGSTTYTTSDRGSGYTYTWSATPTNIFTNPTGTGLAFTTSNVSTSDGTITLQIGGDCPRTISRSIRVGAPSSPATQGPNWGNDCGSVPVECQIDNYDPLASYAISVTGSLRLIGGVQPDGTYTVRSTAAGGTGSINITATNSCGSTSASRYVVGPCGNRPAPAMTTLYPNPATESVDVHIENADAAQPVTVRLFNSYGQPRAEQTSTGAATVRLATDNLPAGLYFVHILRGKEVLSREQLRIEK
ncbi:T9SS type A sorting domain-containing protein [Hymenobacter rubidus]|uniref:T9SS type A sorting domain-containing protein n=1 Tax=Hymenobacter rubidus TaxID=1441626 RepID=UPI00191FAE30|nr:T9SS type A sorting domain-containing protein [Hymenobacter rubidus]